MPALRQKREKSLTVAIEADTKRKLDAFCESKKLVRTSFVSVAIDRLIKEIELDPKILNSLLEN